MQDLVEAALKNKLEDVQVSTPFTFFVYEEEKIFFCGMRRLAL